MRRDSRQSFGSKCPLLKGRSQSSGGFSLAQYKFCNHRFVEIDNYGERLIGCVEGNRWTWRGSKQPIELPAGHDANDLKALKEVRKETAPGGSP